jgi:hypothetical protein
MTRELDHRTTGGLDVRLLWDPGEDAVFVAVKDEKTGESFEIAVGPGDSARDVFLHPYAYAPVRRVVLSEAA